MPFHRTGMDPRKNFKPSHDDDSRDRDGESSGVNQVNPHDTPRTRGTDEPSHQGGDPSEVAPDLPQRNRDRQNDGQRDIGLDLGDDREVRRQGNKLRDRDKE